MKTDKESFDDMLTRCTWHTIQGVVKGEGMRSLMYGVFNIILGWQREHNLLVSSNLKLKKSKAK